MKLLILHNLQVHVHVHVILELGNVLVPLGSTWFNRCVTPAQWETLLATFLMVMEFVSRLFLMKVHLHILCEERQTLKGT